MMKKTRGRQRIEIKKIEDTSTRQVTFTKRRKGLFNKAGELCVLTGAEMAILVESKGGRVFAFAHPSADAVTDMYLENNLNASQEGENPTCMHEEYKKEYEKICEELEVEKSKVSSGGESDGLWWEKSVEDMEGDELEVFIKSLEQLKINVTKKAEELKNLSASSLSDDVFGGLLDEFLSENVGHANENLMMPAVDYNSSKELVLDNRAYEHNDGVNKFPELVLDNRVDEYNDGVNNFPELVLDNRIDEYNDGVNNFPELVLDNRVDEHNDGVNNFPELVLDNRVDEHNDGVNNFRVEGDSGTFGVPDIFHL